MSDEVVFFDALSKQYSSWVYLDSLGLPLGKNTDLNFGL